MSAKPCFRSTASAVTCVSGYWSGEFKNVIYLRLNERSEVKEKINSFLNSPSDLVCRVCIVGVLARELKECGKLIYKIVQEN